jgi:thiol-disulfide isomerase/thioredoxin
MCIKHFLFILFFATFYSSVKAKSSDTEQRGTEVIINCFINNLKDSNEVCIRLTDMMRVFGQETVGFSNANALRAKSESSIFRTIVSGHTFKFILKNIALPEYAAFFSDDDSTNHLVQSGFIIEPGDSIMITMDKGNLFFSGNNTSRFLCQNEILKMEHSPMVWRVPGRIDSVVDYFRGLDSLAIRCLNILDSNRAKINANDYWLFRGTVISTFQHLKNFYLIWKNGFYGDSCNKYLNVLKDYNSPIWNEEVRSELRNKDNVQHSIDYLNFLMEQYQYDSCFLKKKDFNVVKCYGYFSTQYSDSIREWLIYQLVDKNFRRSGQDIMYCIEHSLRSGYILNPAVKKYFEELKRTNIPGSIAFNFSLVDMTGNTIHLSDFRGKVVLLDFWYIGCGACAQTHPYLDSIKKLFNPEKFVLVSICVDYTGRSKKEWPSAVASGKYTSVSNVNLLAEGRMGLDPDITVRFNIKGCPTLILIDKTGRLTEPPVSPRTDLGRSLVNLIRRNVG